MTEEKMYTINEIIHDAKIARSTFDKFAEASNLRPIKVEKRGKKFYSLKDKEFVVNHYQNGIGKKDKEKYTNHKVEHHDEIINLLREQIRQLKQANEQLIHDNDILTNQLKTKDRQIASAHQLADQAQQLHLQLEQHIKIAPSDSNENISNKKINNSSTTNKIRNVGKHRMTTKRKSWWPFW